MSSRTVPRFALTVLLGAALAAPVAAQDPLPQAPPPRESDDVYRLIHTTNIALLRELYGLSQPEVAPAPRAKADDSIEIESSFGTIRIRVLEAATGSFPLGNPPAAPNTQDHIIRRQLEPQMPQPVAPGPVGAPAAPAVMSSVYGDMWYDTEPEAAPAPRERAYAPICWQSLRDDVYALVRLPLPEDPAPTMCPPVIGLTPAGGGAPSPFACEGHATRVPQPTAFVIGVGGLHRVMPMPDPPRFLVAPTPVPTGSFVINSHAGCCGSAPITFGPATVRQTQTGHFMIGVAAPQPVSGPLHGAVNFAYEVCPPCPMPVVPVNPLNGTWYRDLGVALVAVTFAGDEMTVRMTQGDGDVSMTMTLTAHCTVTKDGLIYGAITSADVDVKGGDPKGMELAELSLTLQETIDGPFSFRAKATSAGLMVSHLKIAGLEGVRGKELAIFGGLFKHAKDGKVPELKPIKTSGPVGRCDTGAVIGSAVGAPVGAAIGHCQPGAVAGALIGVPVDGFERIGIDFNNLPVMGQPVAPGAALAPPLANVGPPAPLPQYSPQPVRPASASAPPDAMKQMAQDALQQMIREKDRCGGMTLPSPRYLEHYPQYFVPDPAFPLPRELASQEDPEGVVRRGGPIGGGLAPAGGGCCTTAVKPGVVTWVREIGAKRCVIKLAADHFTATVSEAHETDGKAVTSHLTFTADYHLTRDGVTAIGLVTSVDATCDGDLTTGAADGMEQWLGEIRRALEDKPIALTMRTYGDALVIGNVRMPAIGGLLEGEPSTYIGGRYRTAGDKPLPALKAVKCEPRPLPAYGPPLATPLGGFGLPIPCPPMAYPGVYGPPPLPPGGFCPAPGLPPGLAYPPAPVYAPAAPTGDLLPPQHLNPPPRPVSAPSASLPPIPAVDAGTPIPTVQVIQAVTVPEPRPSMTPPTAPVPTMPEPIAPVVSAAVPTMPEPTAPVIGTGLTLKVGSQPFLTAPPRPDNELSMQRKLYRTETSPFDQIGNEWRRFWFNDLPPDDAPKGIHSGVNVFGTQGR
jgi:hypothetical protein